MVQDPRDFGAKRKNSKSQIAGPAVQAKGRLSDEVEVGADCPRKSEQSRKESRKGKRSRVHKGFLSSERVSGW